METRLAEPPPSDLWLGAMVTGLIIGSIGILALFFSLVTAVMTILLLGVALVVGGAVQTVQGVQARKSRSGVVQLLAGVLALVVGGIMLFNPMTGLTAVTLLLIGLFFADGLFLALSALINREEGWGWQLAFGAVSVVLGGILAAQWPASSLWLLGTLIGVNLVSRGALLVALSFAVRREMKKPTGAPA